MDHEPQLHHRKTIRLGGFDYSRPGAYFVTICSHEKREVLGGISNGAMHPNGWGRIVGEEWFRLPKHYPNVRLDSFVTMPNHIHGIVEIVGAGFQTRPYPVSESDPQAAGLEALPSTKLHRRGGFRNPPHHGLPEIIRGFKTYSARRINMLRGTPGKPFWQRNYYERVIRDERELNIIREYISTNPLRWHADRENPDATEPEDGW